MALADDNAEYITADSEAVSSMAHQSKGERMGIGQGQGESIHGIICDGIPESDFLNAIKKIFLRIALAKFSKGFFRL